MRCSDGYEYIYKFLDFFIIRNPTILRFFLIATISSAIGDELMMRSASTGKIGPSL